MKWIASAFQNLAMTNYQKFTQIVDILKDKAKSRVVILRVVRAGIEHIAHLREVCEASKVRQHAASPLKAAARLCRAKLKLQTPNSTPKFTKNLQFQPNLAEFNSKFKLQKPNSASISRKFQAPKFTQTQSQIQAPKPKFHAKFNPQSPKNPKNS